MLAVVEDGDDEAAGVVKELLDADADVRVGDVVVADGVIDVDVSIGTGVDAAADVDADEGLSRPRWARRDFLFFEDAGVDADADADVDAGDLMGDAGGLMGDVAVFDLERDRDGAGGGVDAGAGVDGASLDVAVAVISGVEADDAGLLLHDG